MLFGKGKPCTWYMTIFNRVGVSFHAIHLIHLTLITTFYFIHTEIYIVKYYHSCSIGRAVYFQSAVLSQSLNLKVKKSLYVWNKNIIPWKVIGRFFFTCYNASKKLTCSLCSQVHFSGASQLMNKNCLCDCRHGNNTLSNYLVLG